MGLTGVSLWNMLGGILTALSQSDPQTITKPNDDPHKEVAGRESPRPAPGNDAGLGRACGAMGLLSF